MLHSPSWNHIAMRQVLQQVMLAQLSYSHAHVSSDGCVHAAGLGPAIWKTMESVESPCLRMPASQLAKLAS